MPRILIADDEAIFCEFLSNVLQTAELGETEIARDGREAVAKLCSSRFDLCILDLAMPYMRGEEVAEIIHQKNMPTEVVVVTGNATIANTVDIMKSGVREILQKPVSPNEIVEVVRPLLAQRDCPPDKLATRLDLYLQNHFADPSLQAKTLCRHFRISSSYMCHLFKKHFDTTYRQHLTQYRIQLARKLLTSSDLPLYLVADECGFADYRTLNTAFKRVEGIAPSAFRCQCDSAAKSGFTTKNRI